MWVLTSVDEYGILGLWTKIIMQRKGLDMSNSAIFTLSGGLLDVVSIPVGMEVIVRDYDQDDIDPELLCLDKDGGRYIEIVYDGE